MDKFPMFSSKNRGSCLFNTTGSKESQKASTNFQVFGASVSFFFYLCISAIRLVLLTIRTLVLVWIHFFNFTVFAFISPLLILLFTQLFLVTNTVVPVQFCHPSHAGKAKQVAYLQSSTQQDTFPPILWSHSYLPCSFKFSADRTRRDMELLTVLANGPWKLLERDTKGSPHFFMSAMSMPWSQECQLTSFHQPNIHRCLWMLLWKQQ